MIPRAALIPNFLTVYDFVYIRKHFGIWTQWTWFLTSEKVTKVSLTKTLNINETTIDTVETYRQTFFLEKIISLNKSFLLIGPIGCGKTTIMKKFLKKLSPTLFNINEIHLNSTTNAIHVQDKILEKLRK